MLGSFTNVAGVPSPLTKENTNVYPTSLLTSVALPAGVATYSFRG